MLGHESELALEIFHNLRAAGENPASGRDLDARILGDVPDPVRAPPVGRTDDEAAGEALAREQNTPGQACLPAACRKENPTRSLLEITVKDPNNRVLRTAKQHGNEVESSSEGFGRHRILPLSGGVQRIGDQLHQTAPSVPSEAQPTAARMAPLVG